MRRHLLYTNTVSEVKSNRQLRIAGANVATWWRGRRSSCSDENAYDQEQALELSGSDERVGPTAQNMQARTRLHPTNLQVTITFPSRVLLALQRLRVHCARSPLPVFSSVRAWFGGERSSLRTCRPSRDATPQKRFTTRSFMQASKCTSRYLTGELHAGPMWLPPVCQYAWWGAVYKRVVNPSCK
jgi:hypothetical protein